MLDTVPIHGITYLKYFYAYKSVGPCRNSKTQLIHQWELDVVVKEKLDAGSVMRSWHVLVLFYVQSQLQAVVSTWRRMR